MPFFQPTEFENDWLINNTGIHGGRPARFPAEQKERSCIETLLFPVSRGRRYNTLYFAKPAIKRLRRSLASLGDCKQSLSLVRRCRTSCKVVCHETAGFFGFFQPKEALPPLDFPANRDAPRPYWMTQRQRRGHCPPLESTQKAKTECAKLEAHSILHFRNLTENPPDLSATFLQVARFPAILTEKPQETLSAETPGSFSWYIFCPAI